MSPLPFFGKLGRVLLRGLAGLFPGIAADLSAVKMSGTGRLRAQMPDKMGEKE
jgi:hypothetical protein